MLSSSDSLYSLFDGSLCVKRVRAHMQIDIVRVTALYGHISVFVVNLFTFTKLVTEVWLFRVDIDFNQRRASVRSDWIRIFRVILFSIKREIDSNVCCRRIGQTKCGRVKQKCVCSMIVCTHERTFAIVPKW